MPRTLVRIFALFFALWLPLQGYAAAADAMCVLPADEGSAMAHAGEPRHGESHHAGHDCCEPSAAASDRAADEPGSDDGQHAANSCCQSCVTTAIVAALTVSPSRAPASQAAFLDLPQPPYSQDAPQRPPRVALS